MQPQTSFRPATSGPTKALAVLALVASGCVVLGWFLPYMSQFGVGFSLSDGSPNIQLAVLGSAFVGAITAIIGLTGQERAAAIGAGAAASVSAMVLVFVAVVYEAVSSSEDFDFGFGSDGPSYGIGFFLHLLAGITVIGILLCVFGTLQQSSREERRFTNPAFAVLGAVGVGAAALGMLLPDNGFSIFDIPSGAIKGAYLTFIATFGLVGVLGFISARPTGAALGTGAALTPLLIWVSSALDDQESGGGFFGSFNDGNSLLVALGAGCAVLFGIFCLAGVGANGARQFELTPADPNVAAHVDSPAAPWFPSREPVAPAVLPSAVPSAVPSGWHPDPTGRHEQRYWNGVAWSEHVADGSTSGIDPI